MRYIMKTECLTSKIIQFNHKIGLNIDTSDLKAISKVAIFLKADSDIETATNVLEWQEQNMDYWYERVESYCVTMFFLACFLVFFVVYLRTYENNILLILCLFAGIILGNLIVIYKKYKHYLEKKFNFKNRKDSFNLIKLTIKWNVPLEQLIKYKQGHCREYARTSVAILLNLDIDPYFIQVPSHVATSIKIGGVFYVIDQSLPLRQLDRWLSYNEVKECGIYKPSKDSASGKIEIEFVQKYTIDNICQNVQNIKNLEHDINNYFRLPLECNNKSKGVPVPIGNKAAFFYDEVTHLSVLRKAVIEIEKQFCNNISKVSYIKIEQLDKDLVAVVYW